MRFFSKIENQIYLEQYDEPQTSFDQKREAADNAEILDQSQRIILHAINLNFMRVHRSDSMDQILDKINGDSSHLLDKNNQKNKSEGGILNKFSLKLNDPNKEQIYD